MSGRRDVVYILNRFSDTIPLRQALDFIDSDDPRTRLIPEEGIELDYIMSRNFSIPVEKQKVLANGTVKQKDAALILDSLPFRISSSHITKEQWMALEIIAANNWERPVYWTACKHSGTAGLDDYLQLDGAAYRLVPLKTPAESILDVGRIDSDILYERLMNIFRWQGVNDPAVWLDSQHIRSLLTVKARYMYTRLALQLLAENDKDRAAEVLNRALELFPASKVPYDFYSLLQAEALYQAEMTDIANTELMGYANQLLGELDYFYSLSPVFFKSVSQKSELNVELLRRIMDISDTYGQKHIGEHIEQTLEQHR